MQRVRCCCWNGRKAKARRVLDWRLVEKKEKRRKSRTLLLLAKRLPMDPTRPRDLGAA